MINNNKEFIINKINNYHNIDQKKIYLFKIIFQ